MRRSRIAGKSIRRLSRRSGASASDRLSADVINGEFSTLAQPAESLRQDDERRTAPAPPEHAHIACSVCVLATLQSTAMRDEPRRPLGQNAARPLEPDCRGDPSPAGVPAEETRHGPRRHDRRRKKTMSHVLRDLAVRRCRSPCSGSTRPCRHCRPCLGHRRRYDRDPRSAGPTPRIRFPVRRGAGAASWWE